jgi:LacI family sucrose operon transcriptional repressor
MSKVTIQQIAAMAEVSKSTVSRYLNHGYISAEKSARVQKAIEMTGFQENFFAKRLKMKQSRLIGIVLPRMDSVSVGRLMNGINQVLTPAGYQGLLLDSHLQMAQEIENIESLAQQGVDGIIVDSLGITPAHIELEKKLSLPVIHTGQENEKVHWLKFNDYEAGWSLGSYLRQLGHRRAVFLGVGEWDRAVGVSRRQGFYDAFLGKAHDAQIVFLETGFDFHEAYRLGGRVLEEKKKGATAAACATDGIALGIMRYLHECGLHVPEALSIAGFGGYDVGAVVYPSLTTVYYDFERMGRRTAQAMLDMLAGRTGAFGLMETVLLKRESVRALPPADSTAD